jgi:ribosomal protein S6--L-glutamate ligase
LFVIDGKVVATIQREAMLGEFRANIYTLWNRFSNKQKKNVLLNQSGKAMDLKVAVLILFVLLRSLLLK